MELSSIFRGKNVLWTFIIVTLLVGVTMVNVASATPDTYFSVDPPLIQGTPEGKFEVNVTITGAPDTYAWSIYVSWDPDRLELVNVNEGDFLHRWKWIPVPPPGQWVPKYSTGFAYVPLDEANVEGEIIIGCTLTGDPATADWASGDGWLCTLEFLVQAEGAAHLNLFNTRLADHLDAEGYPAYTLYDNVDGLVDATSFYYAGLAGWELKVNGKSGTSVGGGLKTTVGTPNLLEAKVENIGSFSVYAQAFFEIRDFKHVPIGPPIEADQGIVLMESGDLDIFSVEWTAEEEAGVYYITAYLFYGELTPDVPDGFSRTLRLRVTTN